MAFPSREPLSKTMGRGLSKLGETLGKDGSRVARTVGTLLSTKGRRRAAVVSAVLVAAAVMGYAVGFAHYCTHFTPNTTVAGIDASGLTVDELAQRLEGSEATYATHVTGDGLDFTVRASDIALDIDSAGVAVDALKETSPGSWFLSLFTHTDLVPARGITYDQDALASEVAGAVEAFNATAERPTDAGIAYDAQRSSYVVTPGAVGSAVSAGAVTEAVRASIPKLRETTPLGDDALARPAIADDDPDLLSALDRVNQIVGLTIPLTLNGKEVASVGPDQIKDWISVSGPEEGYAVSVNRDAIERWSFENLNAVVNGETETRVWEVHSWEVAEALKPKIEAADGSALEVPTITIEERPEESEGHEARGRHIDVNLSTQYARLYDADGKTVLWRSPLVSGNLAENHATPTGEYSILSKETDVVLSGLEDGVVLEEGEEPGPEDYYNSYVRYWMCFQGTDLGLHDADWRWQEEFGGDTYTWNGSHGCINLPVDKAEELFNLIKVGDPVYIHS